MTQTHLVAIASDLHFPHHHKAAWKNFKAWCTKNNPSLVVLAGDLIDLVQLSIFDKPEDSLDCAIDEIKIAVKEINGLIKEGRRIVVMPGIHEDRWRRSLLGGKKAALRGAIGLSFKEQLYAQGLDPSILWREESHSSPGIILGKNALLVRHGDRQSGKFGAANVSDKLLRETPTISTIVGHYHRAQLKTQTVLGKTIFAIANPHLSGDHDYAPWPNWQRGFTAVEFYGRSRLRDCEKFTPTLIVTDDEGNFCYNGVVYAN